MNTSPCVPCCDEVQSVNVPGVAGASAITSTSANFVIPAVGGSVAVSVGDSAMLQTGQNVFIGGANFRITAINGATSITVKYVGLPSDTATIAATVVSGTIVAPGLGLYQVPETLSTVANITDNSTGVAGSTVAAGVAVQTLSFPIQLTSMTTAAADLMTNYVVGFRFKVLSISFVTTTLGTGAGASQTLNLEINSTNLTGGSLPLTLATTTPLGVKVDATAITANNVGTATDTLSVEVAAGGTVFTAGAGIMLIQLQNMDTADAIATLSSKLNSTMNAIS